MNTPNNIDRQAHSLAHSQDPSKWPEPEVATVQDNSTDIKVILANARQTGQLTIGDLVPLTDTEFLLDVESYGDALRKMDQAQHTFMKLPPEVRAKFDNSPVNAHTFLSALPPEALEKELKSWQQKDKSTSVVLNPQNQPTPPTPPSTPSGNSSPAPAASPSAT